MCAVSFAPSTNRGSVCRWQKIPRLLRACTSCEGIVLPGRTAARRGLQLRVVSSESNVPRGCDVLRLSRAAFSDASSSWKCSLWTMPFADEVRCAVTHDAPFGISRRTVRSVSHACDDVYADRSAAGSQHSDSPARSHCISRNSKCVQQLSHR